MSSSGAGNVYGSSAQQISSTGAGDVAGSHVNAVSASGGRGIGFHAENVSGATSMGVLVEN